MNHYWRSPNNGLLAGRHLLSSAGRAYRVAVGVALVEQAVPRCRVTGPLELLVVTFEPWPPRRRDLDNLLKPLLDGLTHGGVVDDDHYFDRVTIERGAAVPQGHVRVVLRPRTDPRRSP